MSTAAVLVDRSRVPHQGAGWHLGSNYTSATTLVTAGRMKCFPVAGTRLQTCCWRRFLCSSESSPLAGKQIIMSHYCYVK